MAVVENKVTGAVVGAGGSTITANFILWLLHTYASASAADAPAVVGFVTFVVASIGAFAGGYLSRHTPRPDVGSFGDEVVPAGDIDPPGNTL